jgi:molecular chaperone GrpE
MKAISKNIFKNRLSLSVLTNTFFKGLTTKARTANLLNAKAFNRNCKSFFSQNEKSKEDKEEHTEDNEKNRHSEENELALEKYKELKTLFNEQQAKMEVLKKKFEDLRSAYLSNKEETEQIKIRNDREVANTKEFAISKFAKDLLDVHDNFQRAMESVADKDIKIISETEKIETYNNFLEGNNLHINNRNRTN